MSKDTTADDDDDRKMRVMRGGGSDSVYGLGMIGAWIYYIGRATDLRSGAIGFLKGLVWPAILVYEFLSLLNSLKAAPMATPAPEPPPTRTRARRTTQAKTPTRSRRRTRTQPAS
jgi:hypothetical protein